MTAKRHVVVLKDLKVGCMLRKSAVQRAGLQEKEPPGPKQPRAMSTAELVAAAAIERGTLLQEVLTELEKRSGEKVLPTLAAAATNYDEDIQKHGRLLLVRYLGRQNNSVLKRSLGDERSVVRAAAAQVVGSKGFKLPDQLIPLLNDSDQDVGQAARQALVQLSRGQDFGPPRNAEASAVSTSMRQWRQWWDNEAVP